MYVRDIMTKPIIGVEPAASIADAARLMLSHRISGLPVIGRDGGLVGVVSEGDFMRRGELDTERKRSCWLAFLAGPGELAGEYVRARGRKVEEVMATDLATIAGDATLEEAVELMTRRGIKRLPVIEDGEAVGIVTRSDLLRAVLMAQPAPDPAVVADERIRQDIVAELEKQSWSSNGMIRVKVDHGAAELSGTIFDECERQAARVAAENVAGVTSVSDTLVWIEPVSGTVIYPPV
jgi:CBS domain-containing protein